jgi:endoglucanase
MKNLRVVWVTLAVGFLMVACDPEQPAQPGTGGTTSATGGTTSTTGGLGTGGATGGTASMTGGSSTGGAATGGTATGGGSSGGGMRDITSVELVKDMGIGWNLGNTLDALGGETAWGNPTTTQAMIQAIASAGFSSIRIPITWRRHFGAAPGYTINATWMNRVQQIVDWSLAAGLYAIINMHHDGGGDIAQGAWIRNASTNYTGVIQEYKALWGQIALRFQSYPDRLIFESMNEVGFDDLAPQAAYDLLNHINGEFVTLVRASGGNNGQRHLLLAGYWTDIDESIRGVVMPGDSRCILSLHYYTPSTFCIDGDPTTWGSAAEILTLRTQFAKVKTNFLDQGIPVILGEYGVVTTTEAASRVHWIEYLGKTAYDYGIAPYLWDPGSSGGLFNRTSLTWPAGLLEALQQASSGQSYTITKG